MTVLSLDLSSPSTDFSFVVRHDITLSEGIVGIFGPSGSGKTTLLRSIAGMNPQIRGSVIFGDRIWQDDTKGIFVPPRQRGTRMLFQEPQLFGNLSVHDNLLFGWRRTRVKLRKINPDFVVELLGLGHLLERKIGYLSGGELQRLAIGRALLSAPKLLLVDEALSSLDLTRKLEVLRFIEQISVELNIAVLYVSHFVDEVARISDQLVLLRDGQLLVQGPTERILTCLDLPRMTAGDEMTSVIRAEVVRHEQELGTSVVGFANKEAIVPAVNLLPGSKVKLLCAASDVSLATELPKCISIQNIFSGVILSIDEESDGAFAYVRVDIGGCDLLSRVTRKSVNDLKLLIGSRVFALVKSAALSHGEAMH